LYKEQFVPLPTHKVPLQKQYELCEMLLHANFDNLKIQFCCSPSKEGHKYTQFKQPYRCKEEEEEVIHPMLTPH
jgi:hypothetical protein